MLFWPKIIGKKISWLMIGFLSLFNAKVHVIIIGLLMVMLQFFDSDVKELLNRIGSWKISKFVGDTTYGLYLVHLLVLYPVLNVLFSQRWYLDLPIYPRLIMSFGLITPVVYGFSYILYITIEKNGIRVGKWISSKAVKRMGFSLTR